MGGRSRQIWGAASGHSCRAHVRDLWAAVGAQSQGVKRLHECLGLGGIPPKALKAKIRSFQAG